MSITIKTIRLAAVCSALLLTVGATAAPAIPASPVAEYQYKQLCMQSCNSDADGSKSESKTIEIEAVGVKFEPLIVYAEVGDTISWTNMAAHLVESIGPMSPAELTPFLSEFSKNYSMTVEQEGIITYKCTPHWGARMGGFIVVGSPDNLPDLVDQYADVAATTAELKAAKGLVKKLRKDLQKQGRL